jgi:hypothetical protein
MVDFGRVVPTSFMTAHFKGHKQNKEKRIWIFDIMAGNGMILNMEE